MNLSHKKALFSAINKLWWYNICYLWVWRGFWKSGFFLFISFFIILVCLNAYGLEVWFNLFMLWLGVPSCLYLVIASLSNVSRLFDWCSHIALLRLDSDLCLAISFHLLYVDGFMLSCWPIFISDRAVKFFCFVIFPCFLMFVYVCFSFFVETSCQEGCFPVVCWEGARP